MGGNGSRAEEELESVTLMGGPYNHLAGGGHTGSQDGGFKPVPETPLRAGVAPSPGMPPVPFPTPPKKWLHTSEGRHWMKTQMPVKQPGVNNPMGAMVMAQPPGAS
eukprot:Hpha_TRINITY_DN3885_c0_g1::TRINITY_DN3885_c0_g1_i1::g.44710::m.44710